ncbi:SusC/RagA family TonB-linked outer membrane protein [Galbibacter sp.]|uniref:SusC/RagA family TonB-linked outer membrane protein n=1 Tax=Galbibacter sp. TaxID=2918471 RepID=UPI003A92E93B
MKQLKTNRRYLCKRYTLCFLFTCFFSMGIMAFTPKNQNNIDLAQYKITLKKEVYNLGDIFKIVEDNVAVNFFYDKVLVNEQQTVHVNTKNVTIKKLLAEVSNQLGLSFKQINNVINVGLKESTKQDPILIKGKITSSADGLGLPGVTIQLKGGDMGVTSDFDGNYEISVNSSDDILVFSYLGFRTVEEQVNIRRQINVALEEDTQQLDEVVVTALGIKREEKSLGYSVQKIGGDQVQTVKGVDVATSLTGKVAGLWIQNSTEFNESPDIRLRGGSSNPLLVIDGVPYGNMELSDVASDDIKEISVLKGATASALYGARGSGGSVIITTKNGGNGLSVNSNNMFFAGYLALPKVQSSYSAGLGGTYSATDYVWGQKLDMGIMAEQWNPETKQYENMPLTSRGKDNFNNFLQPGFIVNNNISFARTGDMGSFRTSFTHVLNKGQYPNLKLNRFNFNVSGTLQLSDNFDIKANLGYNRSMTPQTTGAGYGSQGYMYQILMWTGSEYDLSKYRDYWVVPNEQQNWHYSAWYDNPYLIAYEKLKSDEQNITNVNITADYKLFKGAKLTGRIGYDFYSNESNTQNPSGINSTRGWYVNGLYKQEQYRGYSLNSDMLFNYNKQNLIKNLDIDLTTGVSIYKYEDQYNMASTRNGLVVPGIYSLNNSVERPDVATSTYRKEVNSFLGLASFAYADTFFVDLTGRNDWSSTLPSSSRSYFYPSVAGSLLLTELGVKPSWLDLWKIRGSWTVSKKDLGVYDTNVNYSVNLGVWDGYNTAAYPSTIKTSVVEPETSRTWEFGTAAYMFKNRIMLDMAYYNIYTYNRQVSTSIPASSGFSQTLINIDETIERRGLELTLNASVIKSENFNWDVSLNWSKTHAYYKDLDPVYSSDNLWVKEGGRIDNYTIRDWERDPSGNVVYTEGGLPMRSNYTRFLDYSDPDFLWGFTNTFNYKDFSLYISFDGRVGGTLYNYTSYKMWDTGSHPDSDNQWRYDEVVNGNESFVGNGVKVVSGNVSYDQYGQIIEDTREFATNDTPVSYETYARRYGDGSLGAKDATFAKLRELSFGYTLPRDVSEKIGVANATIALTAQNVFLVTKEFEFADPDWNSDSDLSSPSQRFIGLNIKLQTLAKESKK